MTYRGIFDVKDSATPVSLQFSFALDLAFAESISTASVTAAVYSGTDSTPSAIISGAAAIAAGEVTQTIIGGVEGVTYLMTCNVTTSLGNTLSRFGYLVIAPATI